MVRVIGVGDNTVDKYLHLGQMFPGGNAVNVAVLAHRLGHPASYIGWLGNDHYGALILDALNEEGVDVSHCRVVAGANANTEVTLVNGDRVWGSSTSGVCSQIALTEADYGFIGEHDLTHTSIYSHIEHDIEKLKRASKNLSFDFSDNWERDYLSRILPWVDIALLSYPDQSPSETESLMTWIHEQGPRLVLVTQGARGATLYDGKDFHRQGTIEASVVDTLGAGDAFAACFLVEHLSNIPPQAALKRAAQAAAHTCSYYGAFGHGRPIG